jgi:hypothetical protein
MAALPFDVAAVIARLAALPELQSVQGAAEYAAVTSIKDFRPATAYVVLLREDAADEPPPRLGIQRALVTFGVVLASSHYGDRAGGDAVAALRPLIGAVRASLIGWLPDGSGTRQVHWLQGDLVEYDAGMILWREIFQTQHFIGP